MGREGEGGRGVFDSHTWRLGNHGEDSVAQRRQVVTLWHPTALMDSDCNGVCGGLDNMDECRSHIVFSCETFIRVYINNTLIKKIFLKKMQHSHPSGTG